MGAVAGYSGTPPAQKPGLKDGRAVAIAGCPSSLEGLPKDRAFAFPKGVEDEIWSGLKIVTPEKYRDRHGGRK